MHTTFPVKWPEAPFFSTCLHFTPQPSTVNAISVVSRGYGLKKQLNLAGAQPMLRWRELDQQSARSSIIQKFDAQNPRNIANFRRCGGKWRTPGRKVEAGSANQVELNLGICREFKITRIWCVPPTLACRVSRATILGTKPNLSHRGIWRTGAAAAQGAQLKRKRGATLRVTPQYLLLISYRTDHVSAGSIFPPGRKGTANYSCWPILRPLPWKDRFFR